MKVTDTYKEPHVITLDNAVIRVYRPELSAEERERRMKQIYDAAESLLKAAIRNGCEMQFNEFEYSKRGT